MNDRLTKRGSAATYAEPLRDAPNAALLIDFDNVTMGIRSDLQEQLRRLLDSELFKGKISVQRAYADWRRYPQYIVPLAEASIDLIFAPAFGSNKKNATDIRLAIDALELVFTRPEIGTYVLLSGDSDFSSLVLKLKEYGKYVIGVGIRESSSDLLIQNCDEYFSYSELTGLLQEGQAEHRRRDPWELVVEATTRMKQDGDVMRSDRLKQVMQVIDPNFDEKDAGFSKYSKFLVEAARRGLLRLTKMENGQYEIGIGQNANVPPEVESALAAAGKPAAEPRTRRRRGEREKGRERARGRGAARGLPLAAAFDLLRETLTALGAVGEEATDAAQVRERMVELSEDGEDPIFEGSRFQRLLRQAHDAGVIELAKRDDIYLVKLSPPPSEATETEAPKARRAPRARGRRRAETKKDTAQAAEVGEPESEPATDVETAVPARGTKRNPQFRRGSRGGTSTAKTESRPVPGPAEPEAAVVETAPAVDRGRRSVRGRRGGRSRKAATTTAKPAAKDESTPKSVDEVAPPRMPEPETPQPAAEPALENQDAGSGGLLRRMSAALQRAMGSQEQDGDDDG